MTLIVGCVLVGAVVAVRRVLLYGPVEPGRIALRLVGTMAAVGLVSWGLMLLPPVNDAVLGDLPRNIWDFERICEDDRNGEPFPRAASYEPGPGPHPWVAIHNGGALSSAQGTETKESESIEEEPDPDTVELVACTEPTGSVPGTEFTCSYSMVGPVEFSRGVYTVTVVEARTGDLVGRDTVRGDMECPYVIGAKETGPFYTDPQWEAYADLFADIQAAPSGS
ncbi:hypothetical protein IM697_39965 [Streptomyces ferrugineus]|uniref:Uncharacterized protein n=1 Tax=Streptomyces ferrugineus TaxID=1413221 RepID=A0A7M2SKY6_9ACTN|nr:hypothetical protein [Streptomyces ferrugineus]QOV36128.1 hypothetical protein IM697_39965 [Streptomyces ferrugineus]